MRPKIYILGLFLMGLLTHGHTQSLDEYLKIAVENNPRLKSSYAEFEASLQKVAQVNSLPDPTLSLGYFISPVETRLGPQRAKIGLFQMFPWFGTLKTTEDVFQLKAEAKYQEFLNHKNELFMQVKSAWYPIYEVKRKIILQKENLEILNTYKQLATIGFKNGKNSMVDVIRVDIMIGNVETEIKLLEVQLAPLRVQFNTLLNREESLPIAAPTALTLTDLATNYRKDSLSKAHPMLKSFDLKFHSAQKAEELARKQGMPKFGVGIDYVLVGPRKDVTMPENGKDVLMPMVSMSIPIYRGKYKASVKEAQFNQEAITHYKTNFENSLRSKYEMAWYEIEKSRELSGLYQAQTTKTRQVITLLLTSYSNSGKDFEEILRMQQELIKFQMADANALKSFYTALAKLDYLTAKSE